MRVATLKLRTLSCLETAKAPLQATARTGRAATSLQKEIPSGGAGQRQLAFWAQQDSLEGGAGWYRNIGQQVS